MSAFGNDDFSTNGLFDWDLDIFAGIGENDFGTPYDLDLSGHDWYPPVLSPLQHAGDTTAVSVSESLVGPTRDQRPIPVLPEPVIAGPVTYAGNYQSTAAVASPATVEAVRPTRPPAPKSAECDLCDEVLRDNHALQRHKESKHGDSKYTCACGHECVGRKDNYRRHLTDCKRPHTRSNWECICGEQSEDKASHQAHFESCRHGRSRGRGRPRKH